MTLTPESGTYMVWFVGTVENNTNDSITYTSIYHGGTQSLESERLHSSSGGRASSFCCMAIVTVNGSQAIEGKWRVSANTGTIRSRTLTILKMV
jgi:hypothetical protein